ncbi:SMI1/KNR4 family protein [Pseudotamlana agarivorans]|uniref:SMI1/KNR4 family protein n=1 Tax=Pseudotamlana agarivorans TaxID=481183 RepID=UPI00082F17B3|nr:SMI1/KNR4 family protein [Tamlana agarivorans]
MIEILKPNEFGKISSKEILEFERQIGFPLPNNYSDFLKINNGGQPEFDSIKVKIGKEIQLWSIKYFFGLHNKEYWASMYSTLKSLKNRIPTEFLPIANDGGGNYYLVNLSKDSFGKIYFWNHNTESKNNGNKYYGNIIYLFDSFLELTTNLINDESNIEIKTIETDDEFIIE